MLKRMGKPLFRKIIGIAFSVDGGRHDRAVKSCAAGIPAHRPDALGKSECQRIVNDFGRVMADIANRAISGAGGDPIAAGSQRASTGDNGQNRPARFDRACLPHSPETIREALQTLLKYENDRTNIETLQSGLAYLKYFE